MTRRLLTVAIVAAAAVGLISWLHSTRDSKPSRDESPAAAPVHIGSRTNPAPIGNPSTLAATPSSPAAETSEASAAAPTASPPAEGQAEAARSLTTVVPIPVSNEPDFADPPPAMVMENMRAVFRQYIQRFGGNPVGTNLEITRALNGDNPKDVKLIRSEDGLRLNDKGELIDPWGTPFFFHQLSAKEMEIRCAGPDRVLFTPDDLVMK